jgi:hypothetical protein
MKGRDKLQESNLQIGNTKSIIINSYSDYKWIQFSNQKTEWLEGLKKLTQLYAAYKRLTLLLSTTHRLKTKGSEEIFHVNGNQKRAEVVFIRQNRLKLKTVKNR